MNFFQILFSLCSKTSELLNLINIPLRRAFLHLLMLVIICLAAIVTADYFVDRVEVTRLISNFYDEIGGITLSQDRIQFNKQPEVARSYLMSVLRVDNCPQVNSGELMKKLLGWKQPSGILVMPYGLVFWMRDYTVEEPAYRAFEVPASVLYESLVHNLFPMDWLKTTSEANRESVSAGEIARKASAFAAGPKAQAAVGEKTYLLQEASVIHFAMTTLTMMNGMRILLEMLMLIAIALIFFTLALSFRASLLPRKPGFSRILTLTIYSTFPPFVIATLFAICQLQIISFQLVFFLSYFVYQFLAFNAVFRHFNPEPPQDQNDDDGF